MNLQRRLEKFSGINQQFHIYYKTTEKYETKKRNNLSLTYIAQNMLHQTNHFTQILEYFNQEMPLLISMTLHFDKFNQFEHVLNCIVLGRIVDKCPELSSYALNYFEKYSSPFETDENIQVKKAKTGEAFSNLDLVESCYLLLKNNPDFYRNRWTWSEFIKKYLKHDNPKIRWFACHCTAIILTMNEKQLQSLLNNCISKEDINHFSCLYSFTSSLTTKNGNNTINQHSHIKIQNTAIDKVISIADVYLPKIASSQPTNLVEVKSTFNNLRKIAMGLTTGKAICLEGSVGSGKTALIEHLAAKTGRKLGDNFIKVQLGDQTDSKMLLGTYRCTDVPGEFVWQPGVLTQAVMEGNWLLLEDVDMASMDIASVLASLLENNNLNVPGYRDSLNIKSGFQLFVTQRLHSTISGNHKKHSNSLALLEKHLFRINIDSLTNAELKEIVIKFYEQFRTIIDRMLNVFLLFTNDSKSQISTKSGRLISTRDFFKWCSRAAIDFDVSSQASALKVLQDAIDVFTCSYSNREEALNLAKEISTQLGIINQKAEYFFTVYKPTTKLCYDSITVGRAAIKRTESTARPLKFFFTRPSAVLLERIMCCINLKEPVLLVGETGTGKTSCVQYLANVIGQKLVVINMNQQSDSADLLGGFKPVDFKYIVAPIKREFEALFCEYFKIEPNKTYLSHISFCYNEQRWSDLLKLMTKSYEAAIARLSKKSNLSMLERWQNIGVKLTKLKAQLKQKNALAFAFIEGSLVKAVENGYWVLLDEINLANAETLECLSGLLEGTDSSLCLLERGDKQPVERHPNFILFACMNPSTDVGKKDLPAGLRNRFTEFFVDELTEKNDLLLLVSSYLDAMALKNDYLEKIVNFYLKIRKETVQTLSDGLGHKPHFSLRSLCRALMIAAQNPCGMFKKSLYEAFCLSFLTQLDAKSYNVVETMIAKYLLGNEVKGILKQPIPEPKHSSEKFLNFEGYWVSKGNLEPIVPKDYILTESVRKNLKDLARVVSIGKLPVLLQGDTSVGKTSLITYLAKSSGNKCVRINNHEHTDLQEYIGSYMADSTGKLVFHEGLLVEAMRKGHWIILDELNLAPTDVLEALNRVLDDNRELFIPETQETVKAEPNFMLFATQNPPGAYGGRKMLSRAFRNRFVELHFNEIPPKELEFILHKRCEMAPSYAKKMINVMNDLQLRRRGSAAFSGKQGFITLRDLFRWGERYRLAKNREKLYDWDQHLADEGYLVLAGRVRKLEEKQQILEVLEKHLKRKVVPQNLFTLSDNTSVVTRAILENIEKNRHKHKNIVWTFNLRQLAVTIAKALEFKEPVLLVGETGGGKTTICKLLAENNNQNLITVNCHMHSESSDFIGGLRPVREHNDDDLNRLFEWCDGPLIKAMLTGDIFLADEISLADDSVLERLNSLLEPERTLLLAEKGVDLNSRDNAQLIVANAKFYFIGTMNPGGDYGKKELSPALRNRFTEIWCDSCNDRDDLIEIIQENVHVAVNFDGKPVGHSMMDFVEWLKSTEIGGRLTVSIRDILTWVDFLNKTIKKMSVYEAYLHGACLTFLDGLGTGITGTESLKNLKRFQEECLNYLQNQIRRFTESSIAFNSTECIIKCNKNRFGIKPFYIEIGPNSILKDNFLFNAPTTLYNTLRLLRGMQVNKAILLEGSPGVGKTSLVTALAKSTGHNLFRVNLSDQTDISDLFGADLPIEGGSGGQFSWRDGPLLQALKKGDWILLDELNLASQSVLEGLNACLDHRGEIFIPELGKTFIVKTGTRFFGCQNPLKQGGSRRGLPQSFLNRFIQVYVDALTDNDLNYILTKQFPSLNPDLIGRMVAFNARLLEELGKQNFGHRGGPWQFNLRDLTRWCEAIIYHHEKNPCKMQKSYEPERFVRLIYKDRMRSLTDQQKVEDLFGEVFGRNSKGDCPVAYANTERMYIGDVCLDRNTNRADESVANREKGCLVLRSQLGYLRSLAYCVNLNWMSILVGDSASGKSSIVRTLADLASKTLKTLPVTSGMDTTDILGGFEQTDYTRHLDDIVREIRRFVLDTSQDMLANDRTADVVDLLDSWETYTRIDVDPTKSTNMEDEIRLFLKKTEKLQQIISMLEKKIKNKSNTGIIRNKLENIVESVKKDNSLNAGGKFEWVDSMLIKCLISGDWLLIDNVNLCSPAVLDRLNALLEPHGVLAINERGVDTNGRMIEIKPHPDFRLFLAMDPRNGEISRAMRNRGVEIHLFGEQQNDIDLKALIALEGVDNEMIMKLMLCLHDFIGNFVVVEKSNINELLRMAMLVMQELKHGSHLYDALYNAVIEVYYKTRASVDFACNDMPAVVKTEIGDLLSRMGDSYGYNASITLNARNLAVNSNLAKIKQQAALLDNSLRDGNEFWHFLVVPYFSMSSREDYGLRKQYFNELVTRHRAQSLIDLESNFDKALKQALPKNLPLDYRWIPDVLYKTTDNHEVNKRVFALYISMELKRTNSFVREKIDELRKTKRICLHDCLSQQRKDKSISQFDDELTHELLNIIQQFDAYFDKIFETNVELNDGEVIEVLYLIRWRYALLKLTLNVITKLDNRQKRILSTSLKVHYKWFVKYAIENTFKLLRRSIPKGLCEKLEIIDADIARQFPKNSERICKNYRKFNEKPPPFISDLQLAVANEFGEIYRNYDVCRRGNDPVKIFSVFAQNEGLRDELIAIRLRMDYDSDGQIDLGKIKNVRTDCGDVENRELLPIIDYFARMVVKKLLSKNEITEENIEFIRNYPTIPTDFIGTALLYARSKDNRLLHKMFKLYNVYLLNSASIQPKIHLKLDEENVNLSPFGPFLTYYICNLLLGTTQTINIKLGNYRALSKQNSFLNLVFWRNTNQFYDTNYDFISCELSRISNDFQIFIGQLGKALNVESVNVDPLNLAELCLDRLRLEKSTKTLDFFRGCLESVLEHVAHLDAHSDLNSRLFAISSIRIDMNLMKLILNSQLPLIDPLAKKALKKSYCHENLNYFKAFQNSFAILNDVYSNNSRTLHPYHLEIQNKIDKLNEENDKLGKYVAVRPKNISYESLLKCINYSFSMEDIRKSHTKLQKIINDFIRNETENIGEHRKDLAHFESLMTSFDNIYFEWSKYEHSYPDIIEPLLCNLIEFIYGFKMQLSLLKKVIKEKERPNLNRSLCDFMRVPALYGGQNNYQKQIDSYMKEFSRILSKDSRKMFCLLKCGIQETFNNCLVVGKFSTFLARDHFEHFRKLLDIFVSTWNRQEYERKIKEEEAESLYKMKTKCEEKSEEEQIEDEIKTMFPNYHDTDFGDLQPNPDFDNNSDDKKCDDKTDLIGANVTDDDLKFVMETHAMLMENFTRTEWLRPEKNNSIHPDFVTPLADKFKLLKSILNENIEALNYDLDKTILGSLQILISTNEKCDDISHLVDISSPIKVKNNKYQDFYKDPNVDEVKSSYHILEDLRLRILELLSEWPEQSTLISIITVIDRIYGFEITSPISRFLTGLEILLSKCNEWEEVAHSGVSLSDHSKNLTHQIIAWRKLELNVWKDLLNNTFQKMNEPIGKWWIYLHNVMKEFIYDDKYGEKELIETLQTFITKSNLAEYENRLKLLYIFHCHATYLEADQKKTQAFINILWNLHAYFQHFIPTISAKIKDLRAPIEKKLKDYVKIVRWKDINYWSIKETVDKSHKTLHKYIREFQAILKQPVLQYLIHSSNDKELQNVGIWDRPQRHAPKTYHYSLDPTAYMAKHSLIKKISTDKLMADGVLEKIDNFFEKSRRLCRKTIIRTKYPNLIQSLDSFVTEVIDTSEHLQKLEVDRTLNESKQKSQAKSILQQKHRALADLFKNLSKMGLSFRTGVIEAKLKSNATDFLLKPLDIPAGFTHKNYKHLDEKILTIWDSCEIYYIKSLVRTDVLETTLRNPAPDLGMPNVERCKGFSSHLTVLIQQLKKELTENIRHFIYLRNYSTQLNEICEGKRFFGSKKLKTTKTFLHNILITMNQCKIVLKTCPTDFTLSSDLIEIPMLKPESLNIGENQNGQNCNLKLNLINDISNMVSKILKTFNKCEGHNPCVEYKFIDREYIPINDPDDVEKDLNLLEDKLGELQNISNNTPLNESVTWLVKELNILKADLFEISNNETLPDCSLEKFQGVIENFSKKILIVIQNVFKSQLNKPEEKEEDDEQIEENHISEEILKKLTADLALLDIKKVLLHNRKIAKIVFTTPPGQLPDYIKILQKSLPILEQIILLTEYFITQQVSAYRVLCKMNSILLNIFIELTSKGFCIPPELSEEKDMEGAENSTGGFGAGDGEGKRDVSDQIETEDQLEEAELPGQEKEKDDEDKDCKEEEKGIEMSEDFDGKLQDMDKNDEDDEENDEDKDSDAEEQMGETGEESNKLDKEIWGSDNESEDEGEDEGNEEKGDKGQEVGEKEMGAKENDEENDNNDNNKGDKEREEKHKEINEMDEKEYDDNQVDPYHGNQPELPEPEPMELPEDLNLDDGQEKDDEETQEENPFDIDKMREDMNEQPNEENEEETTENPKKPNDEAAEFSSDDEEIPKNPNEEQEGIKENQEQQNEDEESKENKPEEESETPTMESALDENPTNEDNVEAMDIDESTDKTPANQTATQKSSQPIDEVQQENEPDKEGMGQSQMEESATGHSAQTTKPQNIQSAKQQNEEEMKRKQKPGESDMERSLGDVNEPVKKKLKTLDNDKQENPENEEDLNDKAEMYQHIKEAKEKSLQALDVATKEQVETQKEEIPNLEEDKEAEEPTESQENLPEENEDQEMDIVENQILNPEKLEDNKKENKKNKQHPEGEVLEEIQDIEIEGEIIKTMDVPREDRTTHHTLKDEASSRVHEKLTAAEMNLLRQEVESQLSKWHESPNDGEADNTWQKISAVTAAMAQDLCEQLRLVLEPTQTSRLKGDYRTGKRINMRKVIPYIASQFRKDKIWLRRTKPSKREYQIVLAIDDSSSMTDNHSKELAFESVSLISKALSLLESGQLAVLSFGENIEIVHRLTDQFTDRSGVKLLQKFKFDQNKTRVAKLVDFATEMFGQTPMPSVNNARLLMIMSDGRGVFSEGEDYVRQAVRRARMANIFMVFVIIDSPENKNSILDIRMPVFKDGKLLNIQSYMDVFPFTFYIILRNINSLPSVLSDALRQWFEIVSNLDKL